MTAMTDADRDERLDRFREIFNELDGLRERHELTKDHFLLRWHEAKMVLGDGQEAEAIESIGFLALDDDWIPVSWSDLFPDD